MWGMERSSVGKRTGKVPNPITQISSLDLLKKQQKTAPLGAVFATLSTTS
jgi:hypothetical protein